MAIYDYQGNLIQSIYDMQGALTSDAYDVEGNPIGAKHLTVMTYNTQWFTGINVQQAMQNLIVSRNNPHIIGFQEFSKTGSVSTVAANMLANYRYTQMSSHYNYLYMASKLPLFNIVIQDFENQSGETRAYMKCELNVFGKTITWINTHLATSGQEIAKVAQAKEIFDMVANEEYFIITGDFNTVCKSVNDTEYTTIINQFVDAEYNLANCTVERGFIKTWTDSKTATSVEEMSDPTDNIITSSNISIDSVTFDTTKFSYLNGNSIDHIPTVAHLTIN